MELDEKSNPWNVTSLDDFLFYCCPECDNRIVTKNDLIQHALKNHPLFIHSEVVPKSATESENCMTDEQQPIQNINLTEAVNNEDISEEMEIEETKPELTASSFVTKVNHEIIKIESSDHNHGIPITKRNPT